MHNDYHILKRTLPNFILNLIFCFRFLPFFLHIKVLEYNPVPDYPSASCDLLFSISPVFYPMFYKYPLVPLLKSPLFLFFFEKKKEFFQQGYLCGEVTVQLTDQPCGQPSDQHSRGELWWCFVVDISSCKKFCQKPIYIAKHCQDNDSHPCLPLLMYFYLFLSRSFLHLLSQSLIYSVPG